MNCRKNLTNGEFIAKAAIVHGGKFDYALTDFKNRSGSITITCPTHGAVRITAGNHLNGSGCNLCRLKVLCHDWTKFLEKAELKWGVGSYTYKCDDFEGSSSMVTVTCSEHGSYRILSASSHLAGKGCLACGLLRRKEAVRERARQLDLTKRFIVKAVEKYGDTYTYERTSFRDAVSRVNINCKKHGSFSITPYKFLHGVGCGKCNTAGYLFTQTKNLKA